MKFQVHLVDCECYVATLENKGPFLFGIQDGESMGCSTGSPRCGVRGQRRDISIHGNFNSNSEMSRRGITKKRVQAEGASTQKPKRKADRHSRLDTYKRGQHDLAAELFRRTRQTIALRSMRRRARAVPPKPTVGDESDELQIRQCMSMQSAEADYFVRQPFYIVFLLTFREACNQ